VARDAGYDAVSAEGDAEDLLALILRDAPRGNLLFIRAEHSAGNVQERLNSAGIVTVSAIAYRQNPATLTDEAVKLLQKSAPVILPIFSPRSARLLTHELSLIGVQAPIWLAALSPAVAAAFNHPTALIQIAAAPNSPAMIKAVAALHQ
jgi:uroporphyrinogen-III synthase